MAVEPIVAELDNLPYYANHQVRHVRHLEMVQGTLMRDDERMAVIGHFSFVLVTVYSTQGRLKTGFPSSCTLPSPRKESCGGRMYIKYLVHVGAFST